MEWLVQPPARQSFPLQEGALCTHRLFSRNVEGTGLDRQMAKHLVLEDALGFREGTGRENLLKHSLRFCFWF